MDLYTIDVETYYSREYSLSKITTEEYVRDPRFELIGLGIKKNDKKAKWLSGDILSVYAALQTVDWSNAAILCHNTMFDGAVLAWRLGVRPKVWFDTLSMSRAVFGPDASHSLAALAKRFSLPDKGDEVVRAMGKRLDDFSPEELAAYAEYCKHDTNLCYQIFHLLHDQLPGGFPKRELQLIDMTLRMFTEPRFQLNKPKLEAHLIDTVNAKEQLLKDANIVDKKDLMSNVKFAQLLEQLNVDPPRKVSATTGKEAYAFAKTDEGFKALEEHENPVVQALVAARLGNKTTLEETRTQRFIDISTRGLLPIPLRYYAAHTGRWGGSDKINLQNLPSRGPNAKKIKGAIEAPPGHVIVESDSSQIEARVLAWLAEQQDVVQAFRDREDVYKKMAAVIYGVKEEDVTGAQRQVGKGVVLGCGYGMGADKFQATMKTQGVELAANECRRIVGVYREANHRISQLWKDAGNMLVYMSRDTAYQFGRYGVLTVDPERRGVRLPSGLYLNYPGLTPHKTDRGWEFTYNTRKGPNRIYGGKVVENVTQALARIVVGEQMLRIRRRYEVALTVHDSALIVVPEEEAAAAQGYVEECMRWTPSWAKGLPVDCEAGTGQNYGES
jgi:DNA polymerase I-like protein with 3'-5' exonuclease and polymerase domains